MEGMTMEDVMAASDDQLARKPIHRGMILTGSVIMLSQDGLVVDVGAKIEGLVPYNQLFEFEVTAEDAAKYFKSGDEMQVYVVRSDIPNSTIILSKRRADQERAWNLLSDIYEKKLPVEVEVVEKVRGGLVANLGVRAFLPASQVDVRRVNELDPYVGKRLKVRIIELNRKRNRVIISRRSIIEEELSEKKEETLKKLEPGAKLEGEVVEITDFGVFVNLGGIDGLVHRSEIGHGRFNHPKEVLELGQKVNVEVLDMDLERERINLSMKSLISDPWENVLANYVIGQKVSGVVTNLTPFGAFVEIEAGLEGLIHVSEMSWTKRIRHPKEVVTEGDHVDALVLKIDVGQKRISLGLRQTQPDPWSSLPDRFPPGTEVTGPITGITDFGVFMEIEEGIEGLIHISELAHEHIDNISEHFKRGDEVNAAILNIDPVEQRASLSRKRLLPYTAEMDAAGDAPAGGGQRGGRKGRRGGRRSAGIDYDYSYAASDTGGKATAKLGDVYADLFAQFGLTDSSDEDAADTGADASVDTSADTASVADNSVDTSAQVDASEASADIQADVTEGAAASMDAAVSEQPVAEVAPETAPETEASSDDQATASDATTPDASAPETASADTSEDPDNVIDAAEAAALLTAAFREGKRPASQQDDAEQAPEASAETDTANNAAEDTPQQSEDDNQSG
jgi:small subunit ribosomal protein S1